MIRKESKAWRLLAEMVFEIEPDGDGDVISYLCYFLDVPLFTKPEPHHLSFRSQVSNETRRRMLGRLVSYMTGSEHTCGVYGEWDDQPEYRTVRLKQGPRWLEVLRDRRRTWFEECRQGRVLACLIFAEQAMDDEARRFWPPTMAYSFLGVL